MCGAYYDDETRRHINAAGSFTFGGPQADTGVTGRKIVADTYGGMARTGGGAISGKDPSKVDRSGAYLARYAAKNIVAAGLARACEIQLSYVIGEPRPTTISVDTFGTGRIDEGRIEALIRAQLPAHAARDHRRPRLEAAHLREDGRLRALRQAGSRLHLGTDRQGRGPARRSGDLTPGRGQ